MVQAGRRPLHPPCIGIGPQVEFQRLRSRDREHAIAEERNLLAQELHDSIAQALSFLNIQVKLLQGAMDNGRPEQAQKALDDISFSIVSIIY